MDETKLHEWARLSEDLSREDGRLLITMVRVPDVTAGKVITAELRDAANLTESKILYYIRPYTISTKL